jgi:hypothetical protein
MVTTKAIFGIKDYRSKMIENVIDSLVKWQVLIIKKING